MVWEGEGRNEGREGEGTHEVGLVLAQEGADLKGPNDEALLLLVHLLALLAEAEADAICAHLQLVLAKGKVARVRRRLAQGRELPLHRLNGAMLRGRLRLPAGKLSLREGGVAATEVALERSEDELELGLVAVVELFVRGVAREIERIFVGVHALLHLAHGAQHLRVGAQLASLAGEDLDRVR